MRGTPAFNAMKTEFSVRYAVERLLAGEPVMLVSPTEEAAAALHLRILERLQLLGLA